MTDFTSLALSDRIIKTVTDQGYTAPTPIQVQAIPVVMKGRDLLGIAQTGTGKTAAFALPILDRLAAHRRPRPAKSAHVLVLAPTRELASQIAQSFNAYGSFFRPSVQTIFGGASANRQAHAMAPGVDILVATPGRLLDLINQRAVTLNHIQVLVLDEADQMLDLGFIHSLRKIAAMLPKARQTLFFSATMPKSIADLAAQFLTNPVEVSVAPQATTAERVDQRVIFVRAGDKPSLLIQSLRDQAVKRALVFTRTKHGADRVVRQLAAAAIGAVAIHGNKSQPQREQALKSFRAGHARVLVATDIAARGIDIDDVTHVFNFDVPNVPEQYVHRIGRTARAGAAGIAISFVADEERPYLRDIERTTRVQIPVAALPSGFKGGAAPEVDRHPHPERMNQSRPNPHRAPKPHRGPQPQGERSPQGETQNRSGHPGKPAASPTGRPKQGAPHSHRGAPNAGHPGKKRPPHRKGGGGHARPQGRSERVA